MISFSWVKIDNQSFQIEIKTPVVRVGTLYRLTAAIYILGLDIVTGDVDTIEENGQLFSMDRFLIRILDPGSRDQLMDFTANLGFLMDSIIREDQNPDVLLAERNIKLPEVKSFFEVAPEIVFQDHPEENCTEFYVEALGRRGFLFHLTRTLASENVNILKGTIRTADSGQAEDTFLLQYNDQPLGKQLSEKIEKLILGSS